MKHRIRLGEGVMRRIKLCVSFTASAALFVTACGSPERPSADSAKKEPPVVMPVREDVKPLPAAGEESPFACNMLALTPDGRKRHLAVIKEVLASAHAIEETSDGYAFTFESGEESITLAAECIWRERLCCPFFTFELVAEREGGPVRMRLRGREGVKAFIREEFKLGG